MAAGVVVITDLVGGNGVEVGVEGGRRCWCWPARGGFTVAAEVVVITAL